MGSNITNYNNLIVLTDKTALELVKYVREHYNESLDRSLNMWWENLVLPQTYSNIDEAALEISQYLTRCYSEEPYNTIPTDFENDILSYIKNNLVGSFSINNFSSAFQQGG